MITPSAAHQFLLYLVCLPWVAALLYAPVSKLIGNFILPVAYTGIAFGFYLVATATNVALVTTGVIIAGLFFGWVFPQAFLRVAQVGPKNGGTLTTSVILMGINLGAAFAAPMVNAIAGIFWRTSASGTLGLVAIGFVILAIIEYIYNFFDRKTT